MDLKEEEPIGTGGPANWVRWCIQQACESDIVGEILGDDMNSMSGGDLTGGSV